MSDYVEVGKILEFLDAETNALNSTFDEIGGEAGAYVECFPTADVAPVVRCKDCMKCGFCGADTNLGVMGYYGFCSRGRRRDAK